jgi:hypothetical protein
MAPELQRPKAVSGDEQARRAAQVQYLQRGVAASNFLVSRVTKATSRIFAYLLFVEELELVHNMKRIHEGLGLGENEMSQTMKGLVDTTFEEGQYVGGIDALEMMRSWSTIPPP